MTGGGRVGRRASRQRPAVRTDREFRSLVPPLALAEAEHLEALLAAEGCRDALVVWKGHGVLLDGHNRLEVCERLGLPYRVVEVDLPDRAAAKAWIARNQLARRNLTPFQKAELALVLAPVVAAKARAKQRQGGRTKLPQKSAEPVETRREVAKAAGVSHDTVAKVKTILAHADEDTKAKARAGEVSVDRAYQQVKRAERERGRAARREENRRKVEAAPALDKVDARFATIVVDPPWRYGDDWDPYGRGRPEYATMPLDELAALPVAARADDDCHIYVWTTNRLLPDAFPLIEAWGFEYRCCLTWCKPRIGMGSYFRGSTEHVLFAVRGSQPLKRKDVGTWFEAPRGSHSTKPEEFYDLVESCSPGPYLELFARAERDGWTTWGGEL